MTHLPGYQGQYCKSRPDVPVSRPERTCALRMPRPRGPICICFWLLCSCSLLFAAQSTRDSLLALYARNLAAHHHFSAPFTQTRYLSLFPTPLVAKGEISFSAPDTIKLHYLSPFESIILFTDQELTRYTRENGRYVPQPSMEMVARAITREMVRWLSAGFGDDFPYDISIAPHNPRRLDLVPHSSMARAIFDSIALTFSESGEYISRITLNEANGDSIVIEHDTPDFSPLPASHFAPPVTE